jgi:AraC-like DNA-binding protein
LQRPAAIVHAVIELDTATVPVKDRFAYWHQAMARILAPVELRSSHARNFRANASSCDLGPVRLSSVACAAHELTRTPELIRQSDPESYQVALIQHGTGGVSQGGRSACLVAGDLILLDTSRPFHGWTAAPDSQARAITLVFARALLPLPEAKVQAVTATRLRDSEGVGGLTVDFAAQVASGMRRMSAPTRARVGLVLLDLLSVTLSSYFDLTDVLAVDDRHRVRLAQIDAFIWRNLGDPQLSPPVVAAANHISLRYLHRIFSDEHGVTIAAWIREARLQRCRRDLADPLLCTWSIERIARRWGFTDLASFSRTFKQSQGVSPSAYRTAAKAAR